MLTERVCHGSGVHGLDDDIVFFLFCSHSISIDKSCVCERKETDEVFECEGNKKSER